MPGQIGYALGLFLFVPVGDRLRPQGRKLRSDTVALDSRSRGNERTRCFDTRLSILNCH
jgi:hypothetical protein